MVIALVSGNQSGTRTMDDQRPISGSAYKPIEDPRLLQALNELGRSLNVVTTYGRNHPAVRQAVAGAHGALQTLFAERRKIILGCCNGMLSIDGIPVLAAGALLKSLERRLLRLHITGLRIAQGISVEELLQLAELLSSPDAAGFEAGLQEAGMEHIASDGTRFQAVGEGQTVANESDLAGTGVLVLDDEPAGTPGRDGPGAVHVDQIVAFLKGDVDLEDADVGEELAEMASDPARLAKVIMESVSIRQSVSELAGESLGDIILGCLRRTYTGLRKQPAFQSTEGMADLRKALLMLEENLLERMRNLTGDADSELDRQIVQAIREMDETLGFELAAKQYMQHRVAMESSTNQLKDFIRTHGAEVAGELLEDSEFPSSDWRRIVVEGGKGREASSPAPIATGLNTLATLFEKLESLMKSENADGQQVKLLLGQANENLDDTLHTTREKLDELSKHIKEGESGSIGGEGHNMTRQELLTALSEVAQELMQPLTAINASLEMMLHGYVGDVTEDQRDLLLLASNSGEHLKYLMRELVNIVGCPTNKGIDSRFHTTSDQVVLMQQAS